MARIEHYWYKTNMDTTVEWRICLEKAPAIVHAAIGAPSLGTFNFLMRDCWCLYLFLPPWEGASEINGIAFPFAPRFAVLVPPGIKQRYSFTARSTHLYTHFQLPRVRHSLIPVRAARRLDDSFDSFRRDFETVITSAKTAPRRAQAKLWDMLWDLAMPTEPASLRAASTVTGQSVADRVAKEIELSLAQPLTLQSLAARAELSPAHLTRLFKTHTGKTITRFIRDRRVAHARYLLRTTSRPIKSIAHEVGIPDLHHFNKIIRATLGASPRAIRQSIG